MPRHRTCFDRTLRAKLRARRTGMRWVWWKTATDGRDGWLRVYKPGRGVQFWRCGE